MTENKIVKRPQTDREVIDIVVSLIGEDNNIAIPNGYPESFEGLVLSSDIDSLDYKVMYNSDSMVIKLMTEDKMSEEEAIEFLEFNTFYTKPPGSNEILYRPEDIINKMREHKDSKIVETISGVEVIATPSEDGNLNYLIK